MVWCTETCTRGGDHPRLRNEGNLPFWTNTGQVVEGRRRIANRVRYQVSWSETAVPLAVIESRTIVEPRSAVESRVGQLPQREFRGWIRLEGRGRKRLQEIQQQGRMVTLQLADGWKLDVTLDGYDVNFDLYPLRLAPDAELYR